MTFVPGLEGLGERLLARKKEREAAKGETVWEAYLRRKRWVGAWRPSFCCFSSSLTLLPAQAVGSCRPPSPSPCPDTFSSPSVACDARDGWAPAARSPPPQLFSRSAAHSATCSASSGWAPDALPLCCFSPSCHLCRTRWLWPASLPFLPLPSSCPHLGFALNVQHVSDCVPAGRPRAADSVPSSGQQRHSWLLPCLLQYPLTWTTT